MTICSICKKLTATDEDHIDCKEKRRVELEDKDLKRKIPENLGSKNNSDNLDVGIKAIVEHLSKKKEKTE